MTAETNKKKVIHLAPFDRNIGDNALNFAIEKMLEPRFEIEKMELVGNPFGIDEFRKMSLADAVIFGGGGVIHSCSGGNSRKNRESTGTMWNMDLDLIRELEAKIILYSVGFNKFDGEPEPLSKMGEFFDVLNEKKALVSFRNDLSKHRFLDYFPQFSGIEVMPDPGLFCRGAVRKVNQPYALAQIATDRLEYRYPNGIEHFIEVVNSLALETSCKVILLPHTNADAKIYGRYRNLLNTVRIFDLKIAFDEVHLAMDLYRNAEFTISTRGHSQICSIGNGTPTFALSTHPKARGFMIEIGQEAACFDYLHESIDLCLPRFRNFLDRLPKIRRELVEVNQQFDDTINSFNKKVIEYVEERWTPSPFKIHSLVEPKFQPVLLDEEKKAKLEAKTNAATRPRRKTTPSSRPIGSSTKSKKPPVIVTDKTIAYLPGRRKKVGVGTYSLNGIIKTIPMVSFPARPFTLLKRKFKTSDGFTCGVVISCDANYFAGVATCINAVRRYNPRLPVTFLDAGLIPEQIEQVKKIVDDYKRLDELINLDLTTFPSHLSKAALSSLYSNVATYDKLLYLDVDALVLGDLTPMFEALNHESDIIGVRGNLYGQQVTGKKHTIVREIASEGVGLLQRFFPTIDYSAPGINSGCFIVWRQVANRWHSTAQKLYPFLNYFRTADQALLNVMLTISGLRLKLFDPLFNCMGLQLSKKQHIVQEMCVSINLGPKHCSLYFKDREIVVAHFAGSNKPWTKSIDNPASYAWDWHAALSQPARQEVVDRYSLNNAGSECEFLTVFDHIEQRQEPSFVTYLEAAHIARSKRLIKAAYRLYGKALEMKNHSFAALRSLTLLAPEVGDLTQVAKRLTIEKKLVDSDDEKLKLARQTLIPAIKGRDRKVDKTPTEQELMTRVRNLMRINKPHIAQELIGSLPASKKLSPEIFLYHRYLQGDKPELTAANAQARYTTDSVLFRRSVNAAQRTAFQRLFVLSDYLQQLTIRRGVVAQVCAGTGVFTECLATILRGIPLSLDGKSRSRFLVHSMPIVSPKNMQLHLNDINARLHALVLAEVAGRFSEFTGCIRYLSGNLEVGGLVLVIDGMNKPPQLDCLEGLGCLPVSCHRKDIDSLSKALSAIHLKLVRSYFTNNERILVYSKTKKIDAPKRISSGVRQLERLINVISSGARYLDNARFMSRFKRHVANTSTPFARLLGEFVHNNNCPDNLQQPSLPENPERVSRAVSLEAVKDEFSVTPMDSPPNTIMKFGEVRSVTSCSDHVEHIAYWNSLNAGDVVLCEETGKIFQEFFPRLKFTNRALNRAVESVNVNGFNRRRFLLIGGGGIFHSTSGANGVWQWNIDRNRLREIKTPLVLFAVGLNEFRGTDFYQSKKFRETMKEIAARSIFMGFREKKSCELLRNLLPEHAYKIRYQPCPTTTLLTRLPVLNSPGVQTTNDVNRICINVAFDRPSMRYGGSFKNVMANLDRIVTSLVASGNHVSVVCHTPEDKLFHTFLKDREKVELVSLVSADTRTAACFYNKNDLVIGMRTHSQLIPFGIGVPILSLISHDKLAWTLSDLDLDQWGVEISDSEFVDKVISIAWTILENQLALKTVIVQKQIELAKITEENLRFINTIVSKV